MGVGKKSKSKAGTEDAERLLVFRAVIFGITVAALAAVSGYFVLGVLTQHPNVELSASGSYTVKLIRVPEENREQLERLVDSGELERLFSEELELSVDVLFISDTGEGELALCAGRFDSPGSGEALRLLSKAREYERGGVRLFHGARIRPESAGMRQ